MPTDVLVASLHADDKNLAKPKVIFDHEESSGIVPGFTMHERSQLRPRSTVLERKALPPSCSEASTR